MGEQGDGGPGWPLAAGTMLLGKYRIVRLVGQGGMGAVFEALHVEIGKRVAIKAMSPALAAIPEARARFVREAQVTSRVRHPNIIDVTDIGNEDGQPFLVMEYLEGEDLAQHLDRRGRLALDEVATIALPLLAAVGAAHDEGIVHRDLKPQNIFLAKMGDGTIRPTVLDFGISKAPPQLGDPITTSGGLMGSPSYFAPEQVNDPKRTDAASDQYALGVILYECVTARIPYEGSNLAAIFQAILRGHYLPAQRHRPDLPDEFGAVIARAMSIDPGARFPDLRDMGRALLPFASETARLVWAGHFENGRARAAAAVPARAGVPVTDQMPAPAQVPRAATVSLGGEHRVAASAPPDLERFAVRLSIPRSGRGAWVLGGVALATVGLLAAATLHGRRRAPVSEMPAAPAGVGMLAAPAAVAPPAPVVPSAAPRDLDDEDDGTKAEEPRRERPVRRPRFGPNRAPLIE